MKPGRHRTDGLVTWHEPLPAHTRKENADCCNAHRDTQGRHPIGYCSPECQRRPTTTRVMTGF